MNRKLIRTTLAEVKERELHREHRHMPPPPPPQMAQPAQPKKKVPPEQN
jgi:hypothetical protein